MTARSNTLRIVCALLVAFLLCTSFPFVTVNAATLGDGGYIVLPDAPDERLTAAAEKLAEYLTQITGKDFPIAPNGEGLKFVIDYTDAIADNGYIIETGENEVSIRGSGVRGVICGVYGFLEKYCDCRWYTSSFFDIPENPDLTIPAGERTEYTPFFESTRTDWGYYPDDTDEEYLIANGLTSGWNRQIDLKYGGTFGRYISGSCHTFSDSEGFCAADKYFDEHPEYFALNGGKRQPTQLCLTNEDVYEIVLQEVFDLIETKVAYPGEPVQISLTHEDNPTMCLCENCKALDDANGSHAGTMLTFVNRIARAVKEAGYDNVTFDTFAYTYTRTVPTNVVPEDNVIIRLCPIECCHAHAYNDPTCEINRLFMEDLEGWSKICERIYIWDYSTNYDHTAGLFPDFATLQSNMQTYYTHNVKGVFVQGNGEMHLCDTEFGELKGYLISKLMQDPYLDFEATMAEFNNAFYGAAGEHITEFIKMTMEKPVPENGHLHIESDMTKTLGFDEADVIKADEIWENAKNAVKDNSVYLERVERSELSWRFWKCYYPEYSNVSDIDVLIADMYAFGNSTYKSGGGLDVLWFRIFSYHLIETNFSLWIALAITLIIAIIAYKAQRREYLISFGLSVLGIGAFIWQKSSYLAWNTVAYPYYPGAIWLLVKNIPFWLSLIYIIGLFVYIGTLAARRKWAKRVVGTISGVFALGLYFPCLLAANHLYYNGTTGSLGVGVGFCCMGILAIIIQTISLIVLIRETKHVQ